MYEQTSSDRRHNIYRFKILLCCQYSNDFRSEIDHTLTFTIFVPDEKKAGGAYETITITDTVKRIDSIARKVVLMSTEGRGHMNRSIDFDKIISISGELVDYLDDSFEA